MEVLRMRRQASELAMQITERRNKFRADANTELVRVESELAQSTENSRNALNFIRSAKAPMMRAGVMTANIIWYAMKSWAGMVGA